MSHLIISLLIISCKKDESPVESAVVQDKEDNKTVVEFTDYGDALSTGEIAEPINLIPAMAADSASHNVTQYIYNGLVKYDKDINLVGDLAERWEISDNNTVITFYLKKGVKWHDGVEFTADDVKFTYEFMISDDTPTVYDSDFRTIESVEGEDPLKGIKDLLIENKKDYKKAVDIAEQIIDIAQNYKSKMTFAHRLKFVHLVNDFKKYN